MCILLLCLVFGACLWLEDVTLFLWSLLSQEEFSQQPAGSRGPLNGAQCSALQISHIYRQSAPQWATARPAWPSHCSSRGNFYYIPFLTRWQAEIAEPEPVRCTQPQICQSSALLGQIWIFIWAAWLCYLMRHVRAVSRVSVSQDTITWDTCAGVQDSQTQTADTGFLHRDRCLSSTLVL